MGRLRGGRAAPRALCEKRDRIAYVTLNRPEALNALDDELDDELGAIWQDFADDHAVDVAILTGAGRALCAGVDLRALRAKWESATTCRPRFWSNNHPTLFVTIVKWWNGARQA